MYHFMSTGTGPWMLQLVLWAPDLGFPFSIIKGGPVRQYLRRERYPKCPRLSGSVGSSGPTEEKDGNRSVETPGEWKQPSRHEWFPLLIKLQIHNAAGLLICFALWLGSTWRAGGYKSKQVLCQPGWSQKGSLQSGLRVNEKESGG